MNLFLRCTFFLAITAVTGPAQQACPWLNSATAAGILGGDVKSTVTHTGDKDYGNCEFVRVQGEAKTLLIQVHMLPAPGKFAEFAAQCGSTAVKLKGIGNEAVACGSWQAGGATEEVLARVRDRAFLVRVSTPDAKADHTALRDSVQSAAEQVAGALF